MLTVPTGHGGWHIPLRYLENIIIGYWTSDAPWPAVSMTSTKHILLSTINCFLYASSMVGSYVYPQQVQKGTVEKQKVVTPLWTKKVGTRDPPTDEYDEE